MNKNYGGILVDDYEFSLDRELPGSIGFSRCVSKGVVMLE